LLFIFAETNKTGPYRIKMKKSKGCRGSYSLAAGFILAGLIILTGCAKMGAPTGGIKDTTPPEYIEGTPENRTLNFSGKQIELVFDEYIQLKDLNRELQVSPPMKEKPEILLRDKSIRINLEEPLHPQTTYTINFGKAISDLNEGNPLLDFEFVFSTGDHIDSLSVTGKTLNASDHQPLKDADVLVMLYDNLSDSAPLLEIPQYIGRANSNGLFSINNIRADTFRIMALNDVNGDLKYNPETESVAFLDSMLVVSPLTIKPVNFIRDTLKVIRETKKSGKTNSATLPVADSAVSLGRKLNALNVALYYFLEESNKVYLTTKKRESREKLQFVFSRPLHDSLLVSPINYSPLSGWFIREETAGRDSITYWITDSVMAGRDTLSFKVAYTTTDSTEKFVWNADTVNLRYQRVSEKSTSGRKNKTAIAKDPGKNLLIMSGLPNKGVANPYRSLNFYTAKPLKELRSENIELYRITDTLKTPLTFNCIRDSLRMRNFSLSAAWETESQYLLIFKPGAAEDVFGLRNDSLEIGFTTQKADFYGRIIATVNGSNFPVIIQLIDPKGKIAETKYQDQPGKVVFEYLSPDKYTLKAVYDRNGNRKWDTGDYLKHLQPEQVYFYKMKDALRSNWDLEEIWNISE